MYKNAALQRAAFFFEIYCGGKEKKPQNRVSYDMKSLSK
jgi:hypothetical protein